MFPCIYVLFSSPIGVGDSATVWFEDRSSDGVTPGVIPHDGSPYIFWGKKYGPAILVLTNTKKTRTPEGEKAVCLTCKHLVLLFLKLNCFI